MRTFNIGNAFLHWLTLDIICSLITPFCVPGRRLWETLHKKIRKRLISQTFFSSRLLFYLWQWHPRQHCWEWVIMSMKYWAQQGFNKWQPLLWWSLLHNFSFGNSLFLVFCCFFLNNEIICHSFAIILFSFTSIPSLKITHLICLMPDI